MKYIIKLKSGRTDYSEGGTREEAIKEFLDMAKCAGVKRSDIKSCKQRKES